MPLVNLDREPFYVADGGRGRDLDTAFERAKSRGARIVLVLLGFDCYSAVKLAGDSRELPSQCIKWKNVEKNPVQQFFLPVFIQPLF